MARDVTVVNARKNLLNLLKQTAQEWSDNNALRLSAALSYYSVFSIAPLLVLSVGIAGWFFGPTAVEGHLNDQLKDYVGSQPAQTIQSMVQSTSQPETSLMATIIGLTTLLLGASGVFGQLKDALNVIWGVQPKPGLGWRSFVRERLLSFGMVLVIGFLLLVSFVMTTLLAAFSHWVAVIVQLPAWVWGGGGAFVSLAVVTILFALIFKVLPDARVDWKHLWSGAIFTAILFDAGKFGLAYYLGRESTSSSFGAAGSVVLLLLWVYYASCILLFGAQFTKVYALADGMAIKPTNIAVAVAASTVPVPAPVEGPQPAKESLPAIFGSREIELEAAPVAKFPRSKEEILPYVREHMAAGLIASVGVGMAVGIVSRAVEQIPEQKPQEKVRTAMQLLGSAGMVLLSRYGRQALSRVFSTVASHYPALRRWIEVKA